ncbi:heterokaryon incompatibility [Paramyrothecium foliicola]|nr:heterokaryon incompatibility [Paramyrothecium foliicola]
MPAQWAEDIRCELFRVFHARGQQHALEYQALSYAWGLASRDPLRITVNDCPFRVTANLERALRYVRLTDKPVVLWVDAICIDQSKPEERSSQVAKMCEIYSSAAAVSVFLGDGLLTQKPRHLKRRIVGGSISFQGDNSDDVLTNARLLSWRYRRPRSAVLPVDIFSLISIFSRSSNLSTTCETFQGIPRAVLSDIFEALRRMLTVRWWDRIWVVQEAVVAQSLIIKYGTVSGPWEMFVSAARLFAQHKLSDQIAHIATDDLKVLKLLSRVSDLDHFRQSWIRKQRSNLLSLARHFSSRRASDNRDKIYALLGLTTSNSDITPNYEWDDTTVYKVSVLKMLEEEMDLSALTGDLGRKNRQDLPSWVPDWSATIQEQDRRRALFFGDYNACGSISIYIVSASSSLYAPTPSNNASQAFGRESLARIEPEMTLLAQNLESANNPRVLLPSEFAAALRNFKKSIVDAYKVNQNKQEFLHDTISWKSTTEERIINACDRLTQLHSSSGRGKNLANCESIITDPEWYGDDSSGCLAMKGRFVGEVAWKQTFYSTTDLEAVSHEISTCFFGMNLPGGSYDSVNVAAFAATILSDLKVTKRGVRRLRKDDCEQLVAWMNSILYCGSDKPTPVTTGALDVQARNSFNKALQLSLTNRSIFTTTDGRFGIGPSSLKESDLIYVLPGGNLPFILRPVQMTMGNYAENTGISSLLHEFPRTFNLIGDCYVHGAMDGQFSIPRPTGGSLPHDILNAVLQPLEQEWYGLAASIPWLGSSTLQSVPRLTMQNLVRCARSEYEIRLNPDLLDPVVLEKVDEILGKMWILGKEWLGHIGRFFKCDKTSLVFLV